MKNSKINYFKKQKSDIKKILIVNLHFWPDNSSCSSILHHIAKKLSLEINEVDVITSKPKRFGSNFKRQELAIFKNATDLKVIRLPLLKENLKAFPRIFNAFFLGVYSFIKILVSNYQIVITTSSPPVLTAFIIAIASKIKKIRFIYYCMDINPEIGIDSGDFKNRFLIKLMFDLDKFSLISASPLIVHSKSMQKTLEKRFKDKKIDVKIVNSLSVPKEINYKKNIFLEGLDCKKKGLKIIYAGNIGRFQGLENIIYTFQYLSDYKEIELTILGEGVEKIKLKNLSKKLGTNVKFLDYISYDLAKVFISQADLGLVSLIPNMYKYAYPSKTMSYLEQGLPILATLEKESDLGKDIKKNKFGFVVPINEHKNLADLLIKLSNDVSWKKKYRESSLKIYESKFSEKVILDKWQKIIFQ